MPDVVTVTQLKRAVKIVQRQHQLVGQTLSEIGQVLDLLDRQGQISLRKPAPPRPVGSTCQEIGLWETPKPKKVDKNPK